MNPRARMMLQQRAQLQPGAPGGVPMQPGTPETPGAQQSSPLLAQQLSGRPLPQAPNQPVPNQAQQPQPQQQPQQTSGGEQNDELEGLDNVNELGDLGMGEEDILGMSENFDILEFDDALDALEKMPDIEKEGQTPATSTATSQAPGQTPSTAAQGQNIRAPPPPPYPGPQSQTPTSKVSFFMTLLKSSLNFKNSSGI